MSYLNVQARIPGADDRGRYQRFWGQGRAYPKTWRAWAILEREPGLTLGQLAQRLGLSQSAAYLHVCRLRAWGVLPTVDKARGLLIPQMPYAAQSYLTDEERGVEVTDDDVENLG